MPSAKRKTVARRRHAMSLARASRWMTFCLSIENTPIPRNKIVPALRSSPLALKPRLLLPNHIAPLTCPGDITP
jgi:hypothetical protein